MITCPKCQHTWDGKHVPKFLPMLHAIQKASAGQSFEKRIFTVEKIRKIFPFHPSYISTLAIDAIKAGHLRDPIGSSNKRIFAYVLTPRGTSSVINALKAGWKPEDQMRNSKKRSLSAIKRKDSGEED